MFFMRWRRVAETAVMPPNARPEPAPDDWFWAALGERQGAGSPAPVYYLRLGAPAGGAETAGYAAAPRLTRLLPLRIRAWAWLKVQVTWPWIAADMRRHGWVRYGWRSWGPPR